MREFKLRLGKVFIAFSFVLLFLGLSFNIDSRNNQATEIISSNNSGNNIPNISVDDHDTKNTDSTNTKDDNNNSSNTNDNNKTSPSTDNSSSSGNASTNNNTNNNSNNNQQQSEVQPQQPSVDETVDNLRKSIESTYGITIKYGSETDGYSVGGYGVVSAYDPYLIYDSLVALRRNMALYPTNFFKEIRTAGLPLTIYLIQKYSYANITGITEKRGSGVIISIALDYPFDDSFNHETYHYIEHFIYAKGGSYANWNNYNPTGFSYGVYDEKYVYDLTFSEDSYFVNSYAQSYEYEDRASTFEYMMAPNKISPLNYGKNIWLKAKVMCETIDYYFNSVSPNSTEYWERFVY